MDHPGLLAFYSLGLAFLVTLLAGAVGIKILRLFRLDRFWIESAALSSRSYSLEAVLTGLGLGFGIIAYGVLALGLAGFLTPVPILLLLLVLGAWCWGECWFGIKSGILFIRKGGQGWQQLAIYEKSALMVMGSILALTLLQTLTPPWDYDSLLYHLQGPKIFLQSGRVFPSYSNWLTFYPFTIEMLNTIGLAFGSDRFARLISLIYTVMLALAVFNVGRRTLGRSGGWLAVAVLIGMPILPVWANTTYVDLAWAFYEFMALIFALAWLERGKLNGLVLAGIMMGFAMGIKYMAFGSAGILGLWILWQSWKGGWRTTLRNGALFGFTALLVASPWYLKNFAWTGDPLYPLGPFTNGASEQVRLWITYMYGFGTGKGWLDYLLLPVHIYTQFYRFGTFMGSIEIPSFLFPLIIFYPFGKKTQFLNQLLLLMALRFGIWALGAQQIRFLLPLYPGLCLLTAKILQQLIGAGPSIPRRLENHNQKQYFSTARIGRITGISMVTSMVVLTFVYALIFLFEVRPLNVLFGRESQEEFLSRLVHDYPAVQFIRTSLPEDARVMLLWDGRGYYCGERCLPDVDHSQWTRLVGEGQDSYQVVHSLEEQGITHIMLSLEDADFITQHDPDGRHRKAFDFLLGDFQETCLRELFNSQWARIYRIACYE